MNYEGIHLGQTNIVALDVLSLIPLMRAARSSLALIFLPCLYVLHHTAYGECVLVASAAHLVQLDFSSGAFVAWDA